MNASGTQYIDRPVGEVFAQDGGTLFTHTNEYGRLPLFLRLLAPLIVRKAQRTISKDNLALRDLLEGRNEASRRDTAAAAGS